MDGLKPGPIDHGSYTDDWITVVRPILQTRIAKHAATEITFNLMAVVGDKLLDLQKQLESLSGSEGAAMDIKERIRAEEEKRANYKVSFIRKHTNYWLISLYTYVQSSLHSLPRGGYYVRQAFQKCYIT